LGDWDRLDIKIRGRGKRGKNEGKEKRVREKDVYVKCALISIKVARTFVWVLIV